MSLHIRHIERADASDIQAMNIALVNDGRGMVLTPKDVEATLTDVEQRIDAVLNSGGRVTHFVAVSDDVVIGEVSIEGFRPSGLRHVAMLTLGVHPNAQGKGVGRALMNHVIDWISDQTELVRVELYVRSDNERAIALYDSLGFHLEATRKRFVRIAENQFVDDLIMVRFFVR